MRFQVARHQFAFAVVLAGHILAVHFLLQATATRKEVTQDSVSTMVFLIDVPESTTPNEELPKRAATMLYPKRVSEKKAPPQELSPNTHAESSSTAITDWYSQAQIAADRVLERERATPSRRSFTHEFGNPPEPGRPGLFGPPPVRRAGTVEGGERYWVTDNCYFDFDRKPKPIPQAGDLRLKTRVCVRPIGPSQDALDHLKPDYLKNLPSGKPTDGR